MSPRSSPSYLPSRVGETRRITASGITPALLVTKTSSGEFMLAVEGQRKTRYGDLDETRYMVHAFAESGKIPFSSHAPPSSRHMAGARTCTLRHPKSFYHEAEMLYQDALRAHDEGRTLHAKAIADQIQALAKEAKKKGLDQKHYWRMIWSARGLRGVYPNKPRRNFAGKR